MPVPRGQGVRPDSPKTEGQALARHRSPGGRQQSWDDDVELPTQFSTSVQDTRSSNIGTYRVPSSSSTRTRGPSGAMRGRVVVAAVALGAFAAAAAGQTFHGSHQSSNDLALDGTDAAALMGVGGDGKAAPDVLTVSRTTDPSAEAKKMADNQRVNQQLAATKADDANKQKFVKPAEGTFTSGFGSRWGTTHYGVDIANRIGTPIYAVTDGVVVEAGPASGFGLWVRIQHADGTISVYGHVNTFSVHEGQHVRAGEQIATMGNRGNSTGPHLHFEIWDPSGKKMNPQPWLAERGITL